MNKPVSYINPQYKPRTIGIPLGRIPSLAWLMLAVLGLTMSGEMGAIAAWGLIALWVLRGVDEAVEGLLLVLLLIFLNPELKNGSEFISVVRWVIIIEATLRVMLSWLRNPQPWPHWSKFLGFFVAYTTLTSYFVSWWPLASLTKLAIFSVVVLITYFGIKLGKKDWYQNLVLFGVVITLLSSPLVTMQLGYVRNGYQFQGILSHPQTYGVIMAILMAAALGRWLFGPDKRPGFWQIALLLLMGTTILLSGSRTGYFALFLALIVTLFAAKNTRMLLKRLAFNPITYFLLALTIAYVGVAQPVEEFRRIIFERDVSEYAYYGVQIDSNPSTLSYLLASRSNLIARSWENFLHSPALGTGFGLPSVRVAKDAVTTIGGLPVSIPYEKGFTGTAVLEEVGIIGALLLLALLFSQYWDIHKSKNVAALLLFLTAIFVNMGESVYFASGGIGLLVHIAIAVALVSVEKTIANSSATVSESR